MAALAMLIAATTMASCPVWPQLPEVVETARRGKPPLDYLVLSTEGDDLACSSLPEQIRQREAMVVGGTQKIAPQVFKRDATSFHCTANLSTTGTGTTMLVVLIDPAQGAGDDCAAKVSASLAKLP